MEDECQYAYSDGKHYAEHGGTFFYPLDFYTPGSAEGIAFRMGVKAVKIEREAA